MTCFVARAGVAHSTHVSVGTITQSLNIFPPDTNPPGTVPQPNNNPLDNSYQSPFWLQNPPGIGTQIQYDPETNTYNFQYMTGNTPFGPGAYMDVNEYLGYDLQQSINDYWYNHSTSYGGGNRRGGGRIDPSAAYRK